MRWPAPPLSRPPAEVKAIYVNAWAFGGKKFYDLVRLADRTEVNAFVIDVKDDTGYLTYRSEVPTAIEIGANTQRRAPDVQKRLQVLREHGIYPIARIVVAKDPLLASRKPAWSVRHVNGGLWRDRLDFAWVDAFNDSVWVYASQLAAEAVRVGFAEVQYDYVRFPDEPESRLALAVFPGRQAGETKRQGVARNLKLLGDRTRPLGVPFTIDVFGLTTSAPTDMGIGQMWEDLVTTADVVLPMVYPSHYFRGYYSIKHPNSEPYKVIRRAMQDAIRRSEPLGKTAEIRPYLQAFTLGQPRYTPDHVRDQIRASEELGLTGWVLWNPRSAYEVGYFKSKSGGDFVKAELGSSPPASE
ncbi:MAG TPA: putative glycoside hydrolase [Gemmatimonadales bacterium]